MASRIRQAAILLSVPLLLSGPALGQPSEPLAAKDRTDLLGDPLPKDAVARLGTVRFNPGNMVNALAFSPDGTRLAIWAHDWLGGVGSRLIIADASSGREVKNIALPPCNLLGLRWLANGRGLAFVKLNASEYFIWEFTDEKAALPAIAKPTLNSTKQGDPYGVAISPDGRWLAIGRMSYDGSPQPIELWEITPNTLLSKLRPRELGRQDGHGQFLLFSADGQKLFALSRKQEPPPAVVGPVPPAKMAERAQMIVYETASGKRLREFDVAPPLAYLNGIMPAPHRLLLSPDGKALYIGSEKGSIHAYDWANGKENSSFVAHPGGDAKLGQRLGVAALAISSDGRTLYSSGDHNGLTFWDSQNGKPLIKVPEPLSPVGCMALSPDGAKLAVADPYICAAVHVLDAKTGKDLVSMSGHSRIISGLTVLSDGTVLTAAQDQTVRRWQLENGREIASRRIDVLKTWVPNCCLTADGRGLFAYDNERRVVHVDFASKKMTPASEEPGNFICGTSGSEVLFETKEGKLVLWDSKSGQSLKSFDPPLRNELSKGMMRGAISPDGRRVAVATTAWVKFGQGGYFSTAIIALFDVTTAEVLRQWRTPEARLEHVAFSTDGKYLLVGGLPVRSAAPSEPNEPTLPISAKSALLLLDGQTGEPIRSIEPGVKSPSGDYRSDALAFSVNDFMFAVAQYDGSICNYELATGNVLKTYRGHRNSVTQLAFTADGRRMVSISRDNTGLVWDTSIASLARPQALAAPADREQAWVNLAKPEWELAGPALAALAAEPKVLAALVQQKLPAATAPDFDPEAVKKLSAQLSNPIFAVRERASAALNRLGREVLPLLQDELAKASSAEQRRRLQAIIGSIGRSPVPSEHLRQVRVLALLEQLHSDDARAELQRLAEGHADATLTRDA
ncbi:MAG TPA: WD40 repeat domain-containing protein, partial [Gemmataceae bacterium]|nr:WD40 repeat domain-containing protein [Gemmataceae bacterium]